MSESWRQILYLEAIIIWISFLNEQDGLLTSNTVIQEANFDNTHTKVAYALTLKFRDSTIYKSMINTTANSPFQSQQISKKAIFRSRKDLHKIEGVLHMTREEAFDVTYEM